MGEENSKKRPLDLDWSHVLADKNDDDAEPPTLVIVKAPTPTPTPTAPPPPPPPLAMSGGDTSAREDIARMSDSKLQQTLDRQRRTLKTFGRNLPDKGVKTEAYIKVLEEEQERRKLRIDVDECEKTTQWNGSSMLGASNGCKARQQSSSSQVRPQSEFYHIFSRKIEENTDCKVVSASGKELPLLVRHNSERLRPGSGKTQNKKQIQWPLTSSSRCSFTRDKYVPSIGNKKCRASSPHSQGNNGESVQISLSKKKDGCAVPPSNGARPRKSQIVLLDEDDSQLAERMEPTKKLPECKRDARIYYPSRDDPQSVEIFVNDLDCLAPQAFLTSPIMNFYIRYLQVQESQRNEARHDYLFFNTFFYKKLEQAVSYKGTDKETRFLKFRRWWKGVNIFQKAYVLIPIHEDLHWSLVIICFPEKGDESWPIILHLDSLRFHFSKMVFQNVKSYLIEEWNYMNREVVPSDLPIADNIWKNLPRRIDERVIAVPQQKNDYDCGLFVLYFMERFIKEAPQRLKKRDLELFGKQWFKPEEASNLRTRIQTLLMDEFENADNDLIVSDSPPSSGGGTTP